VRRWNVVVDLTLVAFCALVAALLGQDANWDQLQYHYWYPWQLFHGGFTDPDLYGGRFQNPLPQVPFYLLVTHLPPIAAQAALGAIAGTAAVVARRIAARIIPASGGWLLTLSTVAAAAAMVGAGFRSEVGTSYSDVWLATMLLGGLLLLLRGGAWPALGAGALAGAAVGLKYTSAPFALAAVAALLVIGDRRLARLGMWMVGALVGWAATGAWWAWQLWQVYESPVFPFWNTVFGSRWFPSETLTDERYGVSGVQEWLSWPWDMATGSARVLDLAVRDPRWLALVVIVGLVAIGYRAVTRPAMAVLAFGIVGALVWLAVFGVLRYAIPAEMLVGVLFVWSLTLALSDRVAMTVSLLAVVAAGVLTQSAAGRRVAFADSWFDVQSGAFAALRPGDVVLVDGQYPSTFLLPDSLPPDTTVHVVQKDFTDTPLRAWLVSDLEAAPRVWVLTGRPPSQVDPAIGTIDYDNCTRIRSNVVDRWLCPMTL
jgi:hypothetical protein